MNHFLSAYVKIVCSVYMWIENRNQIRLMNERNEIGYRLTNIFIVNSLKMQWHKSNNKIFIIYERKNEIE